MEGINCSEVITGMIESYLLKRSFETSPYTENKELRYLRAMFNFGMKPQRGWIPENPTQGIEFFPVEKRIHYVPPKEDVLRVILAAEPDTQDYLWTIALTMGRMSEINRLTCQDVNLKDLYVVLYTRKKRGGHLTPRKVPMPEKLNQILSRRYAHRNKRKPEYVSAGRKFAFDVERAIFLTVLHRLMVSGSDRSCDKWRRDYVIKVNLTDGVIPVEVRCLILGFLAFRDVIGIDIFHLGQGHSESLKVREGRLDIPNLDPRDENLDHFLSRIQHHPAIEQVEGILEIATDLPGDILRTEPVGIGLEIHMGSHNLSGYQVAVLEDDAVETGHFGYMPGHGIIGLAIIRVVIQKS
ncbi:MAG: hypothetical protein ACOC6B_02060 [Thermodesulfobacteriota bacterium]